MKQLKVQSECLLSHKILKETACSGRIFPEVKVQSSFKDRPVSD